jgi:P27 family predicted phage terminase small subunit
LDSEGKRCWNRVAASLKAMGILAKTDGEMLAGLCQNWSVFVRCSKILNSPGYLEEGLLKSRNAATTCEAAYSRYSKACVEFGLTPQGRAHLDVSGGKASQDDFDRFLASKKGGAG